MLFHFSFFLFDNDQTFYLSQDLASDTHKTEANKVSINVLYLCFYPFGATGLRLLLTLSLVFPVFLFSFYLIYFLFHTTRSLFFFRICQYTTTHCLLKQHVCNHCIVFNYATAACRHLDAQLVCCWDSILFRESS